MAPDRKENTSAIPRLTGGHSISGLLGPDATAAQTAYAALLRAGWNEESRCSPPPREEHAATDTVGSTPYQASILEAVAAHSGLSVAEICDMGAGHRQATARSAAVFLARTLARVQLTELACVMGRDPATLHNAVARRLATRSRSWNEMVEGARRSLASKEEKRKA